MDALFAVTSHSLAPPPPSCFPDTKKTDDVNATKGAASADSSGPSLRLLRGIRAAGGADGDGARRLEALARRLPVERAALEAAAAGAAAEAREWRAAAREQASAVLSLGQVT